MWKTLVYLDEHGRTISKRVERKEQILAETYIDASCCVLELGARYGSVSCITNKKLSNKTNHVVVEPDERVWEALEGNKMRNDCHFHIIRGFISKKHLGLTDKDDWYGYGTRSIEDVSSNILCLTLEEVQQKYGLIFDTLIADCEGFLGNFFEENPWFYDQLRLIIFEKDYPKFCNYKIIQEQLRRRGFRQVVSLFREVWVR